MAIPFTHRIMRLSFPWFDRSHPAPVPNLRDLKHSFKIKAPKSGAECQRTLAGNLFWRGMVYRERVGGVGALQDTGADLIQPFNIHRRIMLQPFGAGLV